MGKSKNDILPPLEKEILQGLILKARIAIVTGHEELLGDINKFITIINKKKYDSKEI